MNDRQSFTWGLIVALLVALPATVCGANDGSVNPSAADRSEEAVRLAQMASELAQRATSLAAASESPATANAASTPQEDPVIQLSDGASATDIEITDSAPSTLPGELSVQAAPESETTAPATADETATARQTETVKPAADAFSDAAVRPAAGESFPESLPESSGYCEPASYGAGYGTVGCAPRRSLIWVAGAEATFLYPDLNSDPVTFEVEDATDPWEHTFTSQSSELDSLYVAPRVWLGVQGCKWGGGIRYWHMQAGEASFDGFIDGANQNWGIPDAGFFSHSWMEAYTLDFELTRRFCVHDCWMQFSAGIRHAEFQAHDSVTAFAEVTDGVVFGYARANRLSRGTGVVFGLYGRKPLFPCSCVHLFYNAHLSWLWGPTETYAETHASIQVAGDNAGSVNGAHTAVDDDLFVGEIQLGLEWDYSLRCLPANAFFRLAVEYQRWDLGMGYSTATSFAGYGGPPETTLATATARANAPEMDLFGISLGTGLTW